MPCCIRRVWYFGPEPNHKRLTYGRYAYHTARDCTQIGCQHHDQTKIKPQSMHMWPNRRATRATSNPDPSLIQIHRPHRATFGLCGTLAQNQTTNGSRMAATHTTLPEIAHKLVASTMPRPKSSPNRCTCGTSRRAARANYSNPLSIHRPHHATFGLCGTLAQNQITNGSRMAATHTTPPEIAHKSVASTMTSPKSSPNRCTCGLTAGQHVPNPIPIHR